MSPDSPAAILRERLTAQLLSGPPARDPLAVAERLLAIQAQDPRGARLAIRARTQGVGVTAIDHALTEERSMLITTLNRGTLHLVRSEDYPWLHVLTTPSLSTANARRLSQEGVTAQSAQRGVQVIERALGREGPLTRVQLRDRLTAAGVPTAGQALVHLLLLACLRGIAVRGPMVGSQHAYVLVRDWLGESKPVDRDRALAELGRRYLAGHGPADDRDLAKWSGLPLRDARAALGAIAGQLRSRPGGLVDLAGRPAAAKLPRPRLLGAFEPVLLGWTSRELLLGPVAPEIVTGGVFRPFALVGGRAAAVWKLVAGQVVLAPLRRLSDAHTAALENDAKRVTRFLADG